MDVILLEKVSNLGSLGDKVSVKAGYGRNYLIPFGKAVPATVSNIADFEARRAQLQAAADAKLAEAQARANKLADIKVSIAVNAGDEGKLFGSVGANDIAEAVSKAGVAIDRSEVRLPEGSIREVGEFAVQVQVHSDVEATVTVIVVAQ